jgi:uncharacterized membrane protein
MFGLTSLGLFHTVISLIAVVAGLYALTRHFEISPNRRSGRVYIGATLVTCVTAFGIFQHGGFGKAHAAALITLFMLGVAGLAGRSKLFGRITVRRDCQLFLHFLHSFDPGWDRDCYADTPWRPHGGQSRCAGAAEHHRGAVHAVPDWRHAASVSPADHAWDDFGQAVRGADTACAPH